MVKRYIYGGKLLTLKQLNNEFNTLDSNISNYYKEVRNNNNGGGLMTRFRKKTNENIITIKTSNDAKSLIDELKSSKDKVNKLKLKAIQENLNKLEQLQIQEFENSINGLQEVLDKIKSGNIHGYKHHDKMYEYKDHYNNIWRFAGVGIAMTFIFGGISLGTAPTAITALGLVISWIYSKFSTYDEMQKMLIIVLCNSLHMKRNINKLIRIFQEREHKNSRQIDVFLKDEVSPLFGTLVKQIDDFIESLFRLAGDGAAEQFILFLEYEKIIRDDFNLENIDIDKMMSKEKQKFYKVRQFIKRLRNVFTIDEKYRIMLREGNQCLSIFTLLISDVLIYAINANAIGKRIELDSTKVKESVNEFTTINEDTLSSAPTEVHDNTIIEQDERNEEVIIDRKHSVGKSDNIISNTPRTLRPLRPLPSMHRKKSRQSQMSRIDSDNGSKSKSK